MSNELLLEIARCSQLQLCLDHSNRSHPCSTLVQLQNSNSLSNHQVPEPWSGHIAQAPLLFLSSNPSISSEDVFPKGQWTDKQITDYFNNRFGGGHKTWVKDGTKALAYNGDYLRATKFWAGVRQRAIELFEREVKAGFDYALTEIVHCKSKSELGVGEAQQNCVNRYLARVLNIAAARVIVVLGRSARLAFETQFHQVTSQNILGPLMLCGKERIIAFLPHTNAHANRTFEKCLSEHELQFIRSFLRQGFVSKYA